MTKYQPPRGTQDFLGDEQRRRWIILNAAKRCAELFGFTEWETPIFEDTNVFLKMGETSDVVTKEMYTFEDRGGNSLTLRPEGTAGICRALISNGLTQAMPQKVFYSGPMFRYERPQKGRFRQFHQFGIELFGPDTPKADAEVISCAYEFIKSLGLSSNVEIQINTLGDTESREAYRAELRKYLSSYEGLDELLDPFRILDSKNSKWQEFTANAPAIYNFLTPFAKQHYEDLKRELTAYEIPFVENPKIFRGLDYYSHTIFEFVTKDLGAQGTVLAGGRYNNLVEQMGGPKVSAVGWAAGVDRLALLNIATGRRNNSIVVIGEFTGKALNFLRSAGYKAECPFQPGLKNGLKYANKIGAHWALILENDTIILKALDNGQQFYCDDMFEIENHIS